VQEKWCCDPFAGFIDADGNIIARGTQDMKCVTIQHLESIRKLKDSGYQPRRTIHLTFVPGTAVNWKAAFRRVSC
jgi:aminoacylase